MSIKLYDRIKQLSTVLGDGPIGFSGPAQGFSEFKSYYSHNDVVFYAITDGRAYEVGSGVLKLAASEPLNYSYDTIISRSPIQSSNSNNKVSFTDGLKEVFATYPAKHSVYTTFGIGDHISPADKGLAFWGSANELDYDSKLIYNKTLGTLGIRNSNPLYAIDVGGDGDNSSMIRASGFDVGRTGIHFPAQNGADDDATRSSYPGGIQYQHFQKTALDSTTEIDHVISLSGDVNEILQFEKQTTAQVFAGPLGTCEEGGSCPTGYPSFRALASTDIPDLSSLYLTMSQLVTTSGDLVTKLEAYTDATSGVLNDKITQETSRITNHITASETAFNEYESSANNSIQAFKDTASGVLFNTMHVFKTVQDHNIPTLGAGECHSGDMTVGGLNVNGQYSVNISPSGGLPCGLLISHSYVSAHENVKTVFYNASSSPISSDNYNFFITAHRVDYAY
jgi:hypothetical protein